MNIKSTKAADNQPTVSSAELKKLRGIIPSINESEVNKMKTSASASVVAAYVNNKGTIKALQTENKGLRSQVFSELSAEISAIKSSGLSTKAAYKKAIDALKAKYKADKALNFEIGLLTWALNTGLSLNNIEKHSQDLNKWRLKKLTLNDILALIK